MINRIDFSPKFVTFKVFETFRRESLKEKERALSMCFYIAMPTGKIGRNGVKFINHF